MADPNLPLLQDLDQYLERNGILGAHNNTNHQPTLDQSEAAQRIKDEEIYKKNILSNFLQKDEATTFQNENEKEQKKKQFLESLSSGLNQSISIITSEEIIHGLSLYDLCDKCDIIYAFASSSSQWSNSNSIKSTSIESNNNHNHNNAHEKLTFSLKEYDPNAVQEFLALVQGTKKAKDISAECIIECCRIAHFLQSNSLLEEIADIIKASIDAENCAYICILADQLEMPGLLQSSMRFVLDTFDKIETDTIWDDFPESLKHHVVTLRNAAKSSIIARGSQSKVFFSSSNEFLGIFSDTLREHKERLQEAKMRQEEIIEERKR